MLPILDVCCGPKMMWLDKGNPNVIYGDRRAESVSVTDQSNGNIGGTRTIEISPDVQFDFRALPFKRATFHLVVFDPPHLINVGGKSWLFAKYGSLSETWRDDLTRGFSECFRVLKKNGVLIFKWSEVQIPLRDILQCTSHKPLFGHASGKRAGTHWITFMKGLPKEVDTSE